jgi:aspartate-semialdehyde dehydrogenase
MSVNIELESPLPVERAIQIWQDAEGVRYTDEIPTPIDVAGTDEVVIGRLRHDPTRPNAMTYWAVGDNLRKGAATNSVQIAELMTSNR